MVHYSKFFNCIFGLDLFLSNYKHYAYQTGFLSSELSINSFLDTICCSNVGKYFEVVKTSGFISLFIKPSRFSELFRLYNSCASSLINSNVIIDCVGVNFCKQMHFGHLRSGIVGSILKRIFVSLGAKCTIDAHLGDYGATIASVIGYLVSTYLDKQNRFRMTQYDEFKRMTISDLHSIYVTCSSANSIDTSVLIDFENVIVNGGSVSKGDLGMIYEAISTISLNHIKDVLKMFNIGVDYFFSESRYLPLCRYLTSFYLESELFYYDNGRLLCEVNGSKVTLVRSNNTPLYIFTDIACLFERAKFIPDVKRVIYIVDVRQREHFNCLFGFFNENINTSLQLDYIPTGMVKMSGGVTLKSRAGDEYNVLTFVQDVQARLYKISLQDITNALILYDLRHYTTSDYTIDETSFYKLVIDVAEFKQNVHYIVSNAPNHSQCGDDCLSEELLLYSKLIGLYETMFHVTLNYKLNSLFNSITSVISLVKKIASSLRNGGVINVATIYALTGDPCLLLNCLIPGLV